MPLTHYPHGLSSFGVPVFGGLSFGMGHSSQPYFVDKINGGDENSGKDPSKAFLTLERALAVAGAYDVIYIADPGTTASDPNTYTGAAANWTVPVASKGLAIVGIANQGISGGKPMAPSLYAYAAATPIMTVNAPLVAIENLRVCSGWDLSGSENSGIVANDFSEGVSEGYGLSVHNCYFEDVTHTGSGQGESGGAVFVVGQWNPSITRCWFMNCKVGISVRSSGSTVVGLVIEDCSFNARTISKINCDIYVHCQGDDFFIIRDIFIGHTVPSLTGGAGRCININSGVGVVANVYSAVTGGTYLQNGGAGTIVTGPSTSVGIVNVWKSANALAATS